MNFYDLYPGYPQPFLFTSQPNIQQSDLLYKLNDIENRLKKLELRIERLESSNNNLSNNNEPDNGLYMI